MSNLPDPYPAATSTQPGSQRSCLGCFFALSFLLNVVAGLIFLAMCIGLYRTGSSDDALSKLPEKVHSGSSTAVDKVAIVAIEGIIIENLLGYAHKQIEQAARDEHVKAVVLRVDSPGGSVTASDDLYRRIRLLRDGDKGKGTTGKPLVVSMGSVAASGGYYISAPASKIFAEKMTRTGSIGVYSSFPNVAGLAAEYGVSMKTIKAGEIKDAASAFRNMTPKEEAVLQDMVDDAYIEFLKAIEDGRGKLTRKKMLERFQVTPLRPDPLVSNKPATPYTRYRADGGTFTSAKAKELDLIDALGTLEDAIKSAADLAKLTHYHTINYQKPFSFVDKLLGMEATAPRSGLLDADRLRSAFTPRLWYLAPGYEAAGLLAASDQRR